MLATWKISNAREHLELHDRVLSCGSILLVFRTVVHAKPPRRLPARQAHLVQDDSSVCQRLIVLFSRPLSLVQALVHLRGVHAHVDIPESSSAAREFISGRITYLSSARTSSSRVAPALWPILLSDNVRFLHWTLFFSR